MTRHVAFVFTGGGDGERTATALKLAERVLSRGHRVTVFAHDDAAALAAGTGDTAGAVAALLRRGVHGGTLDWVVDAAAADRLGITDRLAPGAIAGDHADLWQFVRDADVVMSVGGGH
jgi:sulfur relay (sulfurtransferase) complex TusBCD TusD component (DsrE family)